MFKRENGALRLTADQFAAGQLMRDGEKPTSIIRGGGAADLTNSSGRIIRYRFSTPKVARDQHTIGAWKLDNYRKNPVFLWAHDTRGLPIGKVLDDLVDNDGYLDGSVEYAERDINPFADTVFQLVRGGYVNAVSTSWDPLKWKFSTDRSRPGGIDFELVDLLELSQVPVPAVPEALATARTAGIDTGPVFDWASRLLEEGDMVAVSRDELEALRREAKMPARPKPKRSGAGRKARKDAFVRDLCHVAWLAYLLSDLDCIESSVEWEAAIEEDGSEIPAQIAAVKKQLGEILVAMAGEEVAELNAEAELERSIDDRTIRSVKCAMLGAMRGQTDHDVVDAGIQAIWSRGQPTRAGKVLSAANEKTLRDAHEMMSRGCDMIRGVFEQNAADDEPDGDEARAGVGDAARELRLRKARARQRRSALPAT